MIKKIIISGLLLGLFASVVSAHADKKSTKPVFLAITVTQSGTSTAQISWITDQPVRSSIIYGVDQQLKEHASTKIKDNEASTSTSVLLNGLLLNTKYYYEITINGSVGQKAESGILSFIENPAAPNFKFIDLGSGVPNALNNNDQVVGLNVGPVLWENGQVIPLSITDRPNENLRVVTDINDAGNIVGYGYFRVTGSTQLRNYYLSNGSSTILGGGFSSRELQISSSGQILDVASNGGFYWSSPTSSAVPFSPGYIYAAMNNNGIIAAADNYIPAGLGIYVGNPDIGFSRFLTGATYTISAINDNNDILSSAGFYHFDGVNLIYLGGGVPGIAMNDSGDVVGGTTLFYGAPSDLKTVSLQDFIPTGYVFQSAKDINNLGDVVGSGLAPDGSEHAFLLKRL